MKLLAYLFVFALIAFVLFAVISLVRFAFVRIKACLIRRKLSKRFGDAAETEKKDD